MYITEDKVILALKLLVEGNSISSTERITGIDGATIMKALALAGERCEKLTGRLIVNVPVADVECDEIWGYVAKKEGHKSPEEENVQQHRRCVLLRCHRAENQARFELRSWAPRYRHHADFYRGPPGATSSRQKFQITTDGFAPYRAAIVDTLSDRISGFAQLIKVYGQPTDGEARYSPAEVIDTEVVPVFGDPDPKRICTSIIERQNLTISMQMRRLTRLTNAFSKKWDSLRSAYCLHFAYYNFCRINKTLRVTPAMEAGITDRV